MACSSCSWMGSGLSMASKSCLQSGHAEMACVLRHELHTVCLQGSSRGTLCRVLYTSRQTQQCCTSSIVLHDTISRRPSFAEGPDLDGCYISTGFRFLFSSSHTAQARLKGKLWVTQPGPGPVTNVYRVGASGARPVADCGVTRGGPNPDTAQQQSLIRLRRPVSNRRGLVSH